jgi:hypothetical protein
LATTFFFSGADFLGDSPAFLGDVADAIVSPESVEMRVFEKRLGHEGEIEDDAKCEKWRQNQRDGQALL